MSKIMSKNFQSNSNVPDRSQKSVGRLTQFLNGDIDKSLKDPLTALQRLGRGLKGLFLALVGRYLDAEDHEYSCDRADESVEGAEEVALFLQ